MNENTYVFNQQPVEQTQEELPSYSNYYNHKPRKSAWPFIIILLLIAGVVVGVLWQSGYFEKEDKEALKVVQQEKLCNAAINYGEKYYQDEKTNSGKVIYFTISKLVGEELVKLPVYNYSINEEYPINTYLRIEVLPNGSFSCSGVFDTTKDTEKPVITLKGSKVMTISLGGKVTDPGYTAIDDKDGDISDKVVRSGNINNKKSGTYHLSYRVRDISGNISDEVIRTYIIK